MGCQREKSQAIHRLPEITSNRRIACDFLRREGHRRQRAQGHALDGAARGVETRERGRIVPPSGGSRGARGRQDCDGEGEGAEQPVPRHRWPHACQRCYSGDGSSSAPGLAAGQHTPPTRRHASRTIIFSPPLALPAGSDNPLSEAQGPLSPLTAQARVVRPLLRLHRSAQEREGARVRLERRFLLRNYKPFGRKLRIS